MLSALPSTWPEPGGRARTLYVREVAYKGHGAGHQPVGWRKVGILCLACHALRLAEEQRRDP